MTEGTFQKAKELLNEINRLSIDIQRLNQALEALEKIEEGDGVRVTVELEYPNGMLGNNHVILETDSAINIITNELEAKEERHKQALSKFKKL